MAKKEKIDPTAKILTNEIGKPFTVDYMQITPLESIIVGEPVRKVKGHYTDTDGSIVKCKAIIIDPNKVINVTCDIPKKEQSLTSK
ncbi:hypothetical protein ES705_13661 [subsurface metagenome]